MNIFVNIEVKEHEAVIDHLAYEHADLDPRTPLLVYSTTMHLVELIQELNKFLNGDKVVPGSVQNPEPAPEPEPAPKPEPATKPEQKPEEPPALTKEDVRKALIEVKKTKGVEGLKVCFDAVGKDSLAKVDPEQYGKLYDKAQEVLHA